MAAALLLGGSTVWAQALTVPADVYFYSVSLGGAGGGAGGRDDPASPQNNLPASAGGAGGAGALVTATLAVNPGDTLTPTLGAGGLNGRNLVALTGGGAGGSGTGNGGRGGYPRQPYPSAVSGAGGGGGGGSVLALNGVAVLQAGGGGGGGGGSWYVPGLAGSAAAAPLAAANDCGQAGHGQAETNPTSDGGGAGGGGGGYTGGAAGVAGIDNTNGNNAATARPATGGVAGTSCYRPGSVTNAQLDPAGGGAGAPFDNATAGSATSTAGAGSFTATPLPSVLLQVVWPANAVAGDTMSATTTGVGAASVNSTAAAGGNTTQGTRVPLPAAGGSLSLPAPSFTGSGTYSAALSCTSNGPFVLGANTPPQTGVVTAADTNVVCTYTLTRTGGGTVTAVPTLGQWALLLLSLSVAGIAAMRRGHTRG
ncbi:MAG: IPTL-CTERM sorting domain-containing protein [Pseudomonadota bacterium]|nr:IPTL-CTERM sorting domain-containing protein [Pseudomonadota bacterium]